MDIDSVNVFKTYEVLEVKDAKVTSVDHVNKRLYVMGDNKGFVTLYQIGADRRSSQAAKEPIRLGKKEVTKVACLHSNTLLVAALQDSNLYIIDFSKNQQEVVIKGGCNFFSYWQGEQGKPKLYASVYKKGCGYRVDIDAPTLQSVLVMDKEFPHPRDPDCGIIHKNGLFVAYADKEYSGHYYDSGRFIENIKRDIKIIEHPIIEIINDDEILFLTKVDKSTFIGLIFDSAGQVAQRTNPSMTAKMINRILATPKHLIVLANDTDVFIFNKHDMMLLQKFNIPDQKNSLSVSYSYGEIVIANTNRVYFLELQSYDDQIKECVSKCRGKEALSIFEGYYSKASKTERRDLMWRNLNYSLGLEYLAKEKYEEAKEFFCNSNFDPTALLAKFYPTYSYDYMGGMRETAGNKNSIEFLANVLRTKRKVIIQEYPNPYQEFIDKAWLQVKQDIKASAWLEYIDYAIIKCQIDLKRYKDLASFFSDSDKIYCTNIREGILKFIDQVENENQIDPSLRKMVLAYLYEIISDFSKALDHWKDYVAIKHAEGEQTPYKVATRILINSQDNKSQFFELLIKHIEWFSQGMNSLFQFFAQIRTDIILPDTIHDRLKLISGSKEYDKILENFYKTMIQTHRIRSEPYHTELAKIYLKKVLNGQGNLHQEFRNFIKDPTSKFEGYDLREMITNFWKNGKKNEGLSKMLLEDEIFLLGREELHTQAIEKLISLKEYVMAEEYCSSKPNKNLLSALFSQYIKLYDSSQGEEKKTMSKRIHLFLQTYSTHPELDPAEVLQNIPDDWYLSEGGFMSYLQAALSQTDFTRKSIKCKRQLTEMNLQNSNYKLVMAQKAWVKITEKEKCAVSGMKIGDKVFDVFPNGVLLMHSTLKSQNETICPITGQNFANTCNF